MPCSPLSLSSSWAHLYCTSSSAALFASLFRVCMRKSTTSAFTFASNCASITFTADPVAVLLFLSPPSSPSIPSHLISSPTTASSPSLLAVFIFPLTKRMEASPFGAGGRSDVNRSVTAVVAVCGLGVHGSPRGRRGCAPRCLTRSGASAGGGGGSGGVAYIVVGAVCALPVSSWIHFRFGWGCHPALQVFVEDA